MATVAECEAAAHGVAARLASLEPELRARHLASRSVSCHLVDLGVLLLADLELDGLHGIRSVARVSGAERAQVRLAVSSDDLIALAEGDLPVASAWASGRLRVQAPARDLLRIRAVLPSGR